MKYSINHELDQGLIRLNKNETKLVETSLDYHYLTTEQSSEDRENITRQDVRQSIKSLKNKRIEIRFKLSNKLDIFILPLTNYLDFLERTGPKLDRESPAFNSELVGKFLNQFNIVSQNCFNE